MICSNLFLRISCFLDVANLVFEKEAASAGSHFTAAVLGRSVVWAAGFVPSLGRVVDDVVGNAIDDVEEQLPCSRRELIRVVTYSWSTILGKLQRLRPLAPFFADLHQTPWITNWFWFLLELGDRFETQWSPSEGTYRIRLALRTLDSSGKRWPTTQFLPRSFVVA